MIVAKTLDGQRVLKDRSVRLSARQRAAFILVDGKKSLDEILAATAAAGVTRTDIDKLFELGLVAEQSRAAVMAQEKAAQLEAKRGSRSPEQRFAQAHPIALMLTEHLGLKGYRLNLQVTYAKSYMDLLALAPKIREAVGPERFEMLDHLLND